MVTFTGMPSPSTMFSAYASLTTSVMLAKTTLNILVPRQLQIYIISVIRNYFFKPKSAKLFFIIEETVGNSFNEIFNSAQLYLFSKIDYNIQCLKISKRAWEKDIKLDFNRCDKIVDFFQGIEVIWSFNCEESKNRNSDETERKFFELSFDKSEREKVVNFYIPFVLEKAQEIKDAKKAVKLYTLTSLSRLHSLKWESVQLRHPTTFDNLAMEKSLKKSIIEDLDRFLTRKDFYRKVGKAWKRGYLLYGPPGTGKSSLIAAMANYLKFDVYDLELTSIKQDSDLRSLLLRTENRSIIVIEDIDCSVDLPNRNTTPKSDVSGKQQPLTLSGLLNFIDGLWSCCGDERIIVFTTNHKDRLDPALLRPGRMDMHIYMSYITIDGLKLLLSKYLNIDDDDQHERIQEIEDLIVSMNVTPAEVAGELMKSDDPEVSLTGLIKFLECKKIVDQELKDEGAETTGIEEIPKGKKVKLDINQHDVSPADKDCN